MHIPDGLMDPLIAAIGWIVALVFLGYAIYRINGKVDDKTIPFMAILGAGIFVAQMLNFPIGGGTTGHLLGAALAAFLLGPWGALVIISVILVIQALIFGDGGLTAMGLNIMNMAVIGSLVAWGTIRIFPNKYEKLAIPIAAWTSVFVASIFAAVELSTSYSISGGIYGISATIAFPTMLGYHAIIGIGEGVITGAIIYYLAKVAPETLRMQIKSKAVEATQ